LNEVADAARRSSDMGLRRRGGAWIEAGPEARLEGVVSKNSNGVEDLAGKRGRGEVDGDDFPDADLVVSINSNVRTTLLGKGKAASSKAGILRREWCQILRMQRKPSAVGCR
jgi:hypothetical protein